MLLEGLSQGIALLLSGDPEVWQPIRVSLSVSLSSTLIGSTLALPLGLALGNGPFRGKRLVMGLLNTAMAIPTVLIGLVVFALLSRQGVFGSWGMLYTHGAMILGQVVLTLPIITGFTAAAVERTDPRVRLTALSLGAGRMRAALAVATERRVALIAAVAAGFGRVISEVGISMMVGGNIRGDTRNITTGIAFETGKGEFARGVALGVVLLAVALAVNALITAFQLRGQGDRR